MTDEQLHQLSEGIATILILIVLGAGLFLLGVCYADRPQCAHKPTEIRNASW
jgi:hypothetical protein